MEPFHLVFNASLAALCCELCHIALLGNFTKSHIQHQHPHLPFALFDLTKVEERFGFVCDDGFPTFMENMTPFGGLPIYSGLLCDYCDVKYRSKDKMRNHHYNAHTDTPCPSSWKACMVQQFNRSNAKSYFQVDFEHSVNDQASTSDNPYMTLVSEASETVVQLHSKIEAETANARLISPWLLSTHWHLFIDGYDSAKLLAMVAYPIPSEFPTLSTLVALYTQHCVELIHLTDDIVLQRLNTPDPAKT